MVVIGFGYNNMLTVEVEYIYFLTRLLRRGTPISLTGSHGGDVTTQELIDRYCLPSTRTLGKKIPIKILRDDPLCTIIFTMQRLDRS